MKNLLAILFFIPTIIVLGQDTTYYYNSAWRKDKPLEPAFYKIVQRDNVDTNKALVTTYFASGKISKEEYYSNYKDNILDGKMKRWYENGQIRWEIDFKNGKYDGKLLTYWENGNPKRIDYYENNKLTNGKCFNTNGKKTVYYDYEKEPEFPGGKGKLMQYVKNETKYPKEAQEKSIEGRVLVGFAINKDGTISDIKIKESSGNDKLDEEAIRVVKKMPNWKSGMEDGEPVKIWFVLPIEFRLN